jgi:hypothetical protein
MGCEADQCNVQLHKACNTSLFKFCCRNGENLFVHNTIATWEDGSLFKGTTLVLGIQANCLGIQ